MIRIKIQKFQFTILDIIYFIGSIVSIIICMFFNQKNYEAMLFLPICFNFCFILLLITGCKRFLTVNIFIFCTFLRYVILPFFQSINPVYHFSSYYCMDSILVDRAIFLMCYEIIFISTFMIFYVNFYKNKIKNSFNKYILVKNRGERFFKNQNRYTIIFLFSIFAIILGILNPKVTKQISFITIRSNSEIRMGQISAISSSVDMMMRQIFVIGLLSIFIISVIYLKENFYYYRPKIVLNLSLLGALSCICIIIAEQRSSQVYSAFACAILLIQVFPKDKNKILKIIISSVTIVLGMLTIYKTFYAFKYTSYLEAISNSSSNINDLVQTMEIYLLGPITVSSSIDFSSFYQGATLKQFLMEIGRSTIGISFLVKSSDFVMTSASYNLFVTANRSISGYLLPITGLGYIFFGFLLSPILICFCFYIAFKLEKIMFNSKAAYVVYFSAYIYIRVATCIVSSNLNTVLNAISIIIISAGVLYIIQVLINKIVQLRRK